MKLRSIRENFISQKMRDAIVSSKALCDRALPVATDTPYEATTGHEMASAGLRVPSGIPGRPRHRRFFGMETRPGTIRL